MVLCMTLLVHREGSLLFYFSFAPVLTLNLSSCLISEFWICPVLIISRLTILTH